MDALAFVMLTIPIFFPEADFGLRVYRLQILDFGLRIEMDRKAD
jgi:hypothetical protein